MWGTSRSSGEEVEEEEEGKEGWMEMEARRFLGRVTAVADIDLPSRPAVS